MAVQSVTPVLNVSSKATIFLCRGGQGSRGTIMPKFPGDDETDGVWMSWWMESPADVDRLHRIKYVEYILHPTFAQPTRRVRDRSSKFRLDTSGWGEFAIHARVVFKDATEKSLKHYLKLYYSAGERTTN